MNAEGPLGGPRIEGLDLHPDDLPSRGGRAPGSQANGSFPKGTGRLSEKSPAGYPPPHHRDDTPGSAGVPPACCPFGCRSVSLRCGSRPPCRREPHGPGRSRGRAPLPVDSGGGVGRSCAEDLCGRDARAPGWASSHDRVTPTGQKCRSILAPVVVEGGRSVLCDSCSWWFAFIDERLFSEIRAFSEQLGHLSETTTSDDLPGRRPQLKQPSG